ncbi:MAG: oxidoreductase [Clostridium sp.]|nr:oxidoreductase [Clostridium sp.]
MKQTKTILSTYSADVFGVCSALYELGGMTVMHDASGCNSTYNTHDEPRWYDSESLVFISGLTEMDAIMGDDQKLIDDMLQAIQELHPAFAALAGSPIPMLIGCDIPTIAWQIEQESGIPCFGFSTNGMHSYIPGASAALAAYARRMTDETAKARPRTVNLLGATPLDFSTNGSIPSMVHLLEKAGWEVIGTWAMGSTPEQLYRAGEASVNLVISSVGLETARVLKERFGTPYVVGTPTGTAFTHRILESLAKTEEDKQDRVAFEDVVPAADAELVIIGESVMSRSLAAMLRLECGVDARVFCPLETEEGILSPSDMAEEEEDALQALLVDARTVVADPMFRPVLPTSCKLISLPHEACSGRLYRKTIPDLTALSAKFFFGGN